MSHTTLTPQSGATQGTASQAEQESLSKAGVRKVLEAHAAREVQKVRWGAVIAGLFLAISTQIVLGLLGIAIGLSSVDMRVPNPLSGFGESAGAWTVGSALVSLFVGGYAASKLACAVSRKEGVLAGILTWATSLVACLWMVFAGLHAADTVVRPPALGPLSAPRIERMAQAPSGATMKGHWFALGGALVSLMAAMMGGAMGAAGTRKGLAGIGAQKATQQEREQA